MSASVESFQARVQGFSSERERASLLRSVSHLRKDQATIAQDSSYDEVASGGQPLSRPFTHVDVITPPQYAAKAATTGRSGGRRLSLDVRRRLSGSALYAAEATAAYSALKAPNDMPLPMASSSSALVSSNGTPQRMSPPESTVDMMSSKQADKANPSQRPSPPRSLASSRLVSRLRRKSTTQLTSNDGPSQSAMQRQTSEQTRPSSSIAQPPTATPESGILSARRDRALEKRKSHTRNGSSHSKEDGTWQQEGGATNKLRTVSPSFDPLAALDPDGDSNSSGRHNGKQPAVESALTSALAPNPAASERQPGPGRSPRISFDLEQSQQTLQRHEGSETPHRGASRRPSLASIAAIGEDETDARSPSPYHESAEGALHARVRGDESDSRAAMTPLVARQSTERVAAPAQPRRSSGTVGADPSRLSSTYDDTTSRRGSTSQIRALFTPRKSQDARRPKQDVGDFDLAHLESNRRGSRTSLSFLRRASQDIKAFATVKHAHGPLNNVQTVTVDAADVDPSGDELELQQIPSAERRRNIFRGLVRGKRRGPVEAVPKKGPQSLSPQSPNTYTTEEGMSADADEARVAFAAVFGPPQDGDLDMTAIEDASQSHRLAASRDTGGGDPLSPLQSRPVSSASATYSFHSATQSPTHTPRVLADKVSSESLRPREERSLAQRALQHSQENSAALPADLADPHCFEKAGRQPLQLTPTETESIRTAHTATTMATSLSPSVRDVAEASNDAIVESADSSLAAKSSDGNTDTPLTVASASGSRTPSLMQSSNDGSMTNGGTSGARRPGQSSRLSQIPRLNSMRGDGLRGGGSGGAGGAGGAGGGAGGGSGGGEGSRDRGGAHAETDDDQSENDTADEADPEGQELSSASESEGSLESDDASEHGVMPGSLPTSRRGSRLSRDDQRASTAQSRTSARPSGIELPPAPRFEAILPPSATSSSTAQDADGNTQASALGRGTWTTFATSSPSETPGWFATPLAGPSTATPRVSQRPSLISASSSQAGTQVQSPASTGVDAAGSTGGPGETSYFNIRPLASTNALGGRNTDKSMPPPSPSIISRSRAMSSASMRTMRSASTVLNPRELPPMPPVTPLHLRLGGRAPSLRTQSPSRKGSDPPSLRSPAISTPAAIVAGSPSPRAPVPPQQRKKMDDTISISPAAARPAIAEVSGLEDAFADRLRMPSAGSDFRSSHGRPGLYTQQSRSLIDLSSPLRAQQEALLREPLRSPPIRLPAVITEEATPSVPAAKQSAQTITSPLAASASLRRRRSMYEVGAAPPPYATIQKVFAVGKGIDPREEEGHENLPTYCCSVHIEGYLPRKMEFSAPGIQSKDRSWRRMYFVLHGTSLRVYKTDLSNDKGAAKGTYGPMEGVHVHMEPMSEEGPNMPDPRGSIKVQPGGNEGEAQSTADGGNEKVPISKPQAGVNEPRSASQPNGTNHASTVNGVGRGHARGNSHNGSAGGGASGVGLAAAVESALTGTISHIPFAGGRAQLIKQYTLQGAESGLAADYLKRRHVVRVRAEGEQFLLQTRNDRHVVDWIEAFQAATNIAMDLERRPMPKFITLPRRRRRRRRENGGDAAERNALAMPDGTPPEIREAAEIAEAQRRSLAEGAARATPSRARNAGRATEPNPSDAFERMLREEEEDSSRRQNGGDLL